MIFDSRPTDWKDLQNKVAQVFHEMGCLTCVEKNINIARGSVNIDVYVKDTKNIPSTIILCECKYWEMPVPQTVIHSFRTIISDSGAHHGVIISKNGFQSGSYDAVKHSNIKLYNWDEFQLEFYSRWLDSMVETVKLLVNRMVKYSCDDAIKNNSGEVIKLDEMRKSFTKNEVKLFSNLVMRALKFNSCIMEAMIFIKEIEPPFKISNFNYSKSRKLTSFNSKREFFNCVLVKSQCIVDEFDNYFNSKIVI